MSTPAHTVLSVQQFLTENGMAPMPRHAYSPDLTPSDIFLFTQMKNVLKGKWFPDAEEVKQKKAEALKGINIDKFKNSLEQWENVSLGILIDKFQNCFEQRKKHLDRCITSKESTSKVTEV